MTATRERNGKSLTTILIVLGVIFLVGQTLNLGDLWPFFIILPGLPFLYAASKADGKEAGLIFPGLMISGTGIILLIQNMTNHWESWAYIWALYPALVGYGMVFVGRRMNERHSIRVGEGMMRWSLMALAGMAIFFEVFVFGIGGFFGWPALFIGIGIYLWLKHGNTTCLMDKKDKRKNDDAPEKRKRDFIYEDDEVVQL
ncbi:MAG: hypothetical protein D6737_07340 [Chloroflexi bacterium]|nr:MAG: hypothetical protein CUN54_07300 [Phototrophicales bacterium]RMF80656.1 MAG: hypothetical protein D6737_07340 [Chloroflexota bacterium]